MTEVARHGLPGDHHFYLTFDTEHEGVEISERLRASYPGEMTIVLQHQYEDLEVDERGFAVTLSFSSRPRRLGVPWQALRRFVDPAASFGLEFPAPGQPQGRPGSGAGEGAPVRRGPHRIESVAGADDERQESAVAEEVDRPTGTDRKDVTAGGGDGPGDSEPSPDGAGRGGEDSGVVRIDDFRKR